MPEIKHVEGYAQTFDDVKCGTCGVRIAEHTADCPRDPRHPINTVPPGYFPRVEVYRVEGKTRHVYKHIPINPPPDCGSKGALAGHLIELQQLYSHHGNGNGNGNGEA